MQLGGEEKNLNVYRSFSGGEWKFENKKIRKCESDFLQKEIMSGSEAFNDWFWNRKTCYNFSTKILKTEGKWMKSSFSIVVLQYVRHS